MAKFNAFTGRTSITANGFESYDMDLYSKLVAKSPKLGLIALENQSETYLSDEVIGEVKPDIHLLPLIEQSKKLSPQDKKRLMESSTQIAEWIISTKTIPHVLTLIAPYQPSEDRLELLDDDLNQLIGSDLDTETKISLIVGQSQFIEKDRVMMLLAQIDEEYSKLNDQGSEINRPHSEKEVLLASALKHHGFITTYRISDGGIFGKKKVVFYA